MCAARVVANNANITMPSVACILLLVLLLLVLQKSCPRRVVGSRKGDVDGSSPVDGVCMNKTTTVYREKNKKKTKKFV